MEAGLNPRASFADAGGVPVLCAECRTSVHGNQETLRTQVHHDVLQLSAGRLQLMDVL